MNLPPDPYNPARTLELADLEATILSLQEDVVNYRLIAQCALEQNVKLTLKTRRQNETIRRFIFDLPPEERPHFAKWYPESSEPDPPETNVRFTDIRWTL